MDLIVQLYPTLSDMRNIFRELFNDTCNGLKMLLTFYQMIDTVYVVIQFLRTENTSRKWKEIHIKGGIENINLLNDNFILR